MPILISLGLLVLAVALDGSVGQQFVFTAAMVILTAAWAGVDASHLRMKERGYEGGVAMTLLVLLIWFYGFPFYLYRRRKVKRLLGSEEAAAVIDATTKKCPFCGEQIKREAVICRFCRSDLGSHPSEIGTASAKTPEPQTAPGDTAAARFGKTVLVALAISAIVVPLWMQYKSLHPVIDGIASNGGTQQTQPVSAAAHEPPLASARPSSAPTQPVSAAADAAATSQAAVSSLAAPSGLDALTGQHERDAAAFIKLNIPNADDAYWEKSQATTLDGMQQILTTLRVLNSDAGPACAAIVEKKLTTPFFLRDEVLKYFIKRTDAAQLHRAIAMLHLQEQIQQMKQQQKDTSTGSEAEADVVSVLNGLYPGLSKEDAANRGSQDTAAVIAEFKMSLLDAAQVMHYCPKS